MGDKLDEATRTLLERLPSRSDDFEVDSLRSVRIDGVQLPG